MFRYTAIQLLAFVLLVLVTAGSWARSGLCDGAIQSIDRAHVSIYKRNVLDRQSSTRVAEILAGPEGQTLAIESRARRGLRRDHEQWLLLVNPVDGARTKFNIPATLAMANKAGSKGLCAANCYNAALRAHGLAVLPFPTSAETAARALNSHFRTLDLTIEKPRLGDIVAIWGKDPVTNQWPELGDPAGLNHFAYYIAGDVVFHKEGTVGRYSYGILDAQGVRGTLAYKNVKLINADPANGERRDIVLNYSGAVTFHRRIDQ